VNTGSELYINRELSLLAFHRRVMEMADETSIPVLERLRFLCISSANLDEFFEVRFAALKQKQEHGVRCSGVDGANIEQLVEQIRKKVLDMLHDQYQLLNRDLIPALAAEGVCFLRRSKWNEDQQVWLKHYMRQYLMPVLSPLGIDPAHPFPRILNKSLHFIASLEGLDAFGREHRLAIIPAPRTLPRIVLLPEEISGVPYGFVFLSSIMHAFAEELFPGMTVAGCYQFRLTRDTELYLDEEEMADLKQTVKGRLQTARKFGRSVRLEVAESCTPEMSAYLLDNFDLQDDALYRVNGPVNLHRLAKVYDYVDRPDLKFPEVTPSMPKSLRESDDFFAVLRKRDVLLHHPFQSFDAIRMLLEQAAEDPNVLAIKQTLYRAGDQSRVVNALCKAASRGKEVNVVVELRARFDEGENIHLSETLQQAGAHVVYGIVGYKAHAKMLLIVRREGQQIVRYTHLGTGNYHAVTTRLYTDMGLLTSDPFMGADVHKLFQELTGLGKALRLKKIIQAPFDLHRMLLERISREADLAATTGRGRIIAKMNGLEDTEIIDALYQASQAGVKIDLIVRGVCCLRPGIKGLSDNIQVRSVLGRFLEHSRIYYFRNGCKQEVFCSSADCMIRNLHGRVETAFPVSVARLRRRVIKEGLRYYLRDTASSWRLHTDGGYTRVRIRDKRRYYSAQQRLLDHFAGLDQDN